MRVNITEIAGIEGAQIEVSEDIPARSLDNGIAGIRIEGDVHVFLKITYTKGKIHVGGTASGIYTTRCARCLEEIRRDFNVELDEYFESRREHAGGIDDYYGYDGTVLDLTDSLRDSILLSFPSVVLCDDNCKGICPKCGKNLNKGECDCVKDDIDIRMEKLKDFFKE